jgi:regulator of telomere elongation helicase 1
MEKVLDALLRSENALLESPTGTGKTLCLLCSALAWQREQAKKLKSPGTFDTTARAGLEQSASQQPRKRRVPTIIYASRTHSQLSQVVRELRNTRYRPKHAVLGSREQMCVNPKVKKPDGSSKSSDINHDCSCLAKEQRCKFKNKLEGFKAPSNESSSQSAWHGTQPVMDMEDLVSMGKTHNVCPFYYTRNQVEDAELVLVPYNYLFDKDSRTTTLADIPWDNAVLIFDEAHNLESFASESASFDFSSKDIAGCMSEIDKALNLNESYPERFPAINETNLLRLKALFLKLEEYLLKQLPQQATSYQGQRIMNIFEQGATITYDNHSLVLGEIKKIFDVFMEVRGGNSKGAPKLELFAQCLKRVFGESSKERCVAKAQSYRVHLTQTATSLPKSSSSFRGKYHDGGNGGRTLSYWCFAPSEAMRELENLGVRSILVTSGTLSPLESYALELDLPFPNRLENPHIITPHQIHVRVMGRGVSNKELTSSYERRQNNDYYIELGNTLASLSCVIPCGMLVFFPSYGVMETSIERWGGPTSSRSSSNNKTPSNFFAAKKSRNGAGSGNSNRYSFPRIATNSRYSGSEQTHSTPWKRLLSQKAVVIEPRSSTDLPDAIADFHRFLNLPKSKGVALFGVCRGKISEGIDFSHDMCRAVIITGLPFAPTFDPKVKMKREFLDQKKAKQNIKASTNGGFGARDGSDKNCSLSGHAWYTQQAHRAVNQAIGRVIRNKRDYGSVILMDSRFALPGNQNGLSKWVRPHILPDEGFGRANQNLAQFYQKAKENAEKEAEMMAASTPAAPKPTNVSLILKYEDEENMNNRMDTVANEDKITKVAFIKDRPVQEEKSDQIQNDVHENYVDPQRVIARVDMNKLPSLVVPSTKYSQQVQPKPNTIKPKNPPTSTALQFFKIAQSTMTKDEFDSIRNSIRLMKKFTDLKFQEEFLGAARSIIGIIFDHEPIYGRSRKQKPELLGLLLQLLPKHFLNDVQEIAVDLVFRSSIIRKELKPVLASNIFKKVHLKFVSFLQEVWFQEGNDKNSRQALQRLEKLLKRIVTSHRITKSALSQFVDIVPSEIRRVTMALIEGMKDSIAVTKIRAEENSRIKEAVVKSEYFRKNYHARNQELNKDEEESNSKNIEPSPAGESESKEMQSKLHSHSNLQGLSKKRITMKNPYAKSTGKIRALSNIRQNVSSSSGCKVVGKKETLSAILDKKKRNIEVSNGSATTSSSSLSSSSSLQKILRQSGSDTFAGSTKKMRRTTFSSNAPKNMTCTLCNLPLDKLYISECGHTACLECVSRWLYKHNILLL